MDETQIMQIIQSNNKDLLSQMTSFITSSISGLKRSNEQTAAEQMMEIKRIKTTETPSFKKKSNQEQYKFTKAALDTVADAQYHLEQKDFTKTKEALEIGTSILKERQKLILLADKSLYGWKTVVEYKQHDLAVDEEDERKIYRAEARAAKSVKRFATPRGLNQRRLTDMPIQDRLPGAQIPTIVTPRPGSPYQVTRNRSYGVCFSCGKPGHWRNQCPVNYQLRNSQLPPK